jgi:O-antigen/teichoic acid export membrane protein
LNNIGIKKKILSFYSKIQYVRLRPFDVSTHDGLNKERYRRVVLSTLSSFIGKFISVFTAFYSVPLTLNYLGTEMYGLLMVITSINVLLIFSDLGLGNGLVNHIAKNSTNQNSEDVKFRISSVFFILCLFSMLLLCFYFLVENNIQWNTLFNIKDLNYTSDIKNAITIYIICFIVNVPLSVVYKVQMGFQEMFILNIWQTIGNLLGFILLMIFIELKFSLPYLIFALNGAPLILTLINFINEFFRKRKYLRPNLEYFDFKISIDMIGVGVIFTLINLANVFGSSFDNFILTNNGGPSSLINYSIVTKLFSILYIITYFSAPFWPAFAEAIARKDRIWAINALKNILFITTGITLVACIFLVFFYKVIISYWVGNDFNPALSLILGFAVFWIFSAIAQAAVNFMQSEKYLKKLLLFTLFYSIVSFSCKILFVKSFGDTGVIWAGALSYGLLFALPITLYSFRTLRNY